MMGYCFFFATEKRNGPLCRKRQPRDRSFPTSTVPHRSQNWTCRVMSTRFSTDTPVFVPFCQQQFSFLPQHGPSFGQSFANFFYNNDNWREGLRRVDLLCTEFSKATVTHWSGVHEFTLFIVTHMKSSLFYYVH